MLMTKRFCVGLALLAVQALPVIGYADAKTAQTGPSGYSCRVVYASEDRDIPEKLLTVGAENEGHGGSETSFNLGKQKVTVQANHKFMNLLWERDNKVIAYVVTAQDQAPSNRVVIAFNPNDDNQRMQFSCEAAD